MSDIDIYEDKFSEYLEDWSENIEKIRSEQDTRFKIIDDVVTDILRWDKFDIDTELNTESGGYIDYLLTDGSGNRMVVEAKKAGTDLVSTQQPQMAWYKAGGSVLQPAEEGLEQAKRYCTDEAVPFCLLTTGLQWIGFWALRTDGKPPMDGKAAVFPSLQSVEANFSKFYELFSSRGIADQLYKAHVHEAEGMQVHHAEELTAVLDRSDIHLIERSDIYNDLENIYRRFFSTMADDEDEEMLARCFVESKESREADDQLEKITRNLVNTVNVVSERGEKLQREIRDALELEEGEFVLIIGSKGSGKSTFIDRFFRIVLDRRLRERCLVLKIDLSDSEGDESTIIEWLNERLKEEIENKMFDNGVPSYDELQGAFIKEYRRWSEGSRKHLYENNKRKFKDEFGKHIQEKIDEDPISYIKRLLGRAVKARELMPCIIFDNTDHFSQVFQEKVFQYAMSLHRSNLSFVICPITDRTIWRLGKEGPLQSYENTRSFYLPVPSTDKVIKKRIDFIKEKIEEESEEYFLSKGIKLSVGDIKGFAAVIEEIFINKDYIGRLIGWLSNHDIRRSLRIAQRTITSPILDIKDLLSAYISGDTYTPRERKIKRALINGDYNHFLQEDSDFILNIFRVDPNMVTSPLIRLSILRLLKDRLQSEEYDPDKSYMTVRQVQNYFEPARVSRRAVREHLRKLMRYRLVVPYDPTDDSVYDNQQVKVSHSGRIHYELAFADSEASYLSQMALTTPVSSRQYINQVDRILNAGSLSWRDWKRVCQLFVEYCLRQDKSYLSFPATDTYNGQRAMRIRLADTWDADA